MSYERSPCSETGDARAMMNEERIVLMHQPLLWSLAKRLGCGFISCEELVQAGNVGLLYALQRYDPDQHVKLMTYAVPWILGEMRKAMKKAASSMCSLDESLSEEGMTLYDIVAGHMQVDIGSIDLRFALSRLTQEEQALICLRYFRDKTQKETSLLMGRSQAQISRMERHALDTLMIMLK